MSNNDLNNTPQSTDNYYNQHHYSHNSQKVRTSLVGATALAIVSTILALLFIVFTFCFIRVKNTEFSQQARITTIYKDALENFYKNSYYQLTDSLDNMEVNLSKLIISTNSKTQTSLLSKLQAESSVAGSCISELPIKEAQLNKTVKYINQVSDYSSSLINKINNGENITQEEKSQLANLYKILTTLKDNVGKLSDEIKNSLITNNLTLEDIDSISSSFNEMEETIFDYPKLIYDGPFSDTQKNDQNSTLSGKKVSQKKAEQLLSKYVKHLNPTNITFNQKINSQGLSVFAFTITAGESTYEAHITEINGSLLSLNGFSTTEKNESINVNAQYCLDKAQEFAQTLNFNVQPVWVSKTIDDYIYVNLCPVVDQVICYPDLVKMTFDTNTGLIIGVESLGYLKNHKERNLEFTANPVEASKKIDSSLKILNTEIALIPKSNEEVLCYEFKCTNNNNQYFVYVDVKTLQEVDILRVITGTEGHTVI